MGGGAAGSAGAEGTTAGLTSAGGGGGVASSFLASASEIHRAGALSPKMAAAAGEPLKEQVKRGVDELRKAN